MPEPNVYSLLLQAFHADKSAARLLHALEELAGRLEVCGDGTSTCSDQQQQAGSVPNTPKHVHTQPDKGLITELCT